jgi:hypothetical protein
VPLGLSIEWDAVSPYAGAPQQRNTDFARLVRALSDASGSPTAIRVGGNSTDQSWWNSRAERRTGVSRLPRVAVRANSGVAASLVQLNEETNLFDGRVVITEGTVLAVTAPPTDKPALVRQFIAVRSPTSADFRAVCPVANDPDLNLEPGDHVRLRGIVLAAGIFVGGSGSERRRIAMVCSTVQRLPARSRQT